MVAPLVAVEALGGAARSPAGHDPDFDDSVVMPDDLDDEIDEWENNRFRLYGASYRLTWLDQSESDRIASTAFGVEVS